MKKILAVLFAFSFPFLSAGCVPEIIRAGADRDKELYGHQLAQAEAKLAAKKPACSFVAAPGEPMTFSGVERIECWASGGDEGIPQIQQRVSPFWAWSTANSGILGFLAFSKIMFPDGVASGVTPAQVVEQDRVVPVQPQIVDPFVRPPL